MAENLLQASQDKITRNIKDSVFCDLFGRLEYLYQLYQTLHPEDTDIQPDDLTIITLSRIFVQTMYNDLGFLAGNRLLILVEQQSTWSDNIVVRTLLYLAETYRRYIEKNDLDIYTEKRVELPKPELYVIYTGEAEEEKLTEEDFLGSISLKRNIFQAEDSCVEIEAKVIRSSLPGDIIDQYIAFSKVFDRQRRIYLSNKRKAVQETIRICKDRNILKEYLSQEEAATVMFTFADQEKAFNKALKNEYNEGEKNGEIKGEIKGVKKGEILGTIKIYFEEMDLSPEEIVKKVQTRFGLKEKAAKAYVEDALGIKME